MGGDVPAPRRSIREEQGSHEPGAEHHGGRCLERAAERLEEAEQDAEDAAGQPGHEGHATDAPMALEVPIPEAAPQLERRQRQVQRPGQDVHVGQPGIRGVSVLELGLVGQCPREHVRNVGRQPEADEDGHDDDQKADRHPDRPVRDALHTASVRTRARADVQDHPDDV